MHVAKFLAITNNTNNYAGVRQFAAGQNPPSCASALKQCGKDAKYASLHIV